MLSSSSCPNELVTRLKMDKADSLEKVKVMSDSYLEACDRSKKSQQCSHKPSPQETSEKDATMRTPYAEGALRHRNYYVNGLMTRTVKRARVALARKSAPKWKTLPLVP